ncbi:hypothetical protein ACLOAV_004498 [Pseudogymnoascus australis]
MRKRSDKDKGATAINGAVLQIASTNSTVNLFLGGNQVRSWMNGTAAALTPISRAKPNSVVTSSTGGNIRSKPNTTTTILPSPAPSDEPSPAQESVGRTAPVTRRKMDMQAEELVVQSPEGQEEPMMGQQGQTESEPQAARTPGTMESPMIIEQGPQRVYAHTPVEMGEVQSPGMLQSLMMGQQRNTPTESQAMRSPSTQTVRNPSTEQPSPMIPQRNTPTEAQAVQSPTTQQPPPTVQQGHASTAPHAVQSPPAGSVAYNRVYLPLAPAPPTKRRKMTSANHPSLKAMVPIIEQHVNSCGGMRALASNIERQRIRMLQEACRNDDYFYVALHQMFFLWSLDPDLVARLAMPKGGLF